MSNQANLINLEILRMARDLVTNEYIDRRAQLHNKWLNDCNDQFGTLPYPDIPPYPTESDVVARAQTLLNFLLDNNQKVGGVIKDSDSIETNLSKIDEPAIPPICEPVLENIISECTGPTGVGIENLPADEVCTGPTGTAETDLAVSKSKSKSKVPMPPEEFDLIYARSKSNYRENNDSTALSNIIPGLMRNIKNSSVV